VLRFKSRDVRGQGYADVVFKFTDGGGETLGKPTRGF
jgi:hypothetical protein